MNFNEFIGFKNSSNVRASLNSIANHNFHRHKSVMEIICVLSGSVEISDGALDRTLSFGDVFIFNAQDSHRLHSRESNIILTLHIRQDHYSRFFPTIDEFYFLCDSSRCEDKNTNEMYHLRFLMSQLYFEYNIGIVRDSTLEKTTCELLALLFDKFQYYVFTKVNGGVYEVAQTHPEVGGNIPVSRVYEILNYIFTHFGSQLRLADIAAKQFLSAPYLSKCIKEVSGLTFGELLSLARCEEAGRLLTDRNRSMDEISDLVGFSSRSHLAANFKKWYGKTPSEYRRAITTDLKNPTKNLQNSFDVNFAEIILTQYLNGTPL